MVIITSGYMFQPSSRHLQAIQNCTKVCNGFNHMD